MNPPIRTDRTPPTFPRERDRSARAANVAGMLAVERAERLALEEGGIVELTLRAGIVARRRAA